MLNVYTHDICTTPQVATPSQLLTDQFDTRVLVKIPDKRPDFVKKRS